MMEKMILVLLGVLALAIIALHTRQAVKGFSSNDDTKCCSCGNCTGSCGIKNGEVE